MADRYFVEHREDVQRQEMSRFIYWMDEQYRNGFPNHIYQDLEKGMISISYTFRIARQETVFHELLELPD